jgi:hypothetical protein
MADVFDNLREFGVDLQKFARTMDIELEKVIKRVAFELHDRIIERTPVDTGAARASWNMSLNTPDESTADPGKGKGKKLSAGAATAKAKGTQRRIKRLDPYRDVVWITNALPYIRRLEEGSSKQAPIGMVAVSMAEVEAGMLAELG